MSETAYNISDICQKRIGGFSMFRNRFYVDEQKKDKITSSVDMQQNYPNRGYGMGLGNGRGMGYGCGRNCGSGMGLRRFENSNRGFGRGMNANRGYGQGYGMGLGRNQYCKRMIPNTADKRLLEDQKTVLEYRLTYLNNKLKQD